jgi:flagellar biosynthetic protein FliR
MIFQLEKLLLILTRITSFIVITPGYSYKGIPNTLKIGISIAVTMFAYMATPEFTTDGSMALFIMMIVREVFVGLALGFVSQVVFSVIEMAGNLIDFQAGFSMATVYDPAMGAQASNYGRTYYYLAIAVFFLMNMHQVLMETILRSFNHIPLAAPIIEGFGAEAVLVLFYRMFELGINLAAPMVITVLITDAILGIIARTVPQINVFMLGMPMKAMVSFMVFMVSVAWVMNFAGSIIGQIPGYIESFIELFSQAV